MNWKIPTPSTIWDGTVVLVGLLLVAFKKELLDWLKDLFTKASQRFARPSEVVRIRDAQLKAVMKAGLDGLDLVVWSLLNEYKAQRVTVTKYEKKDATYLATCLSQALASEMPSVMRDLQNSPVDSSVWEEIERIHHLPGRKLYVPDAQLVDVAVMRDALLSTGVWSAYYQSLPTSKGKPWAILAVSWNRAHPVDLELLGHLHSSGIVCATVLLIMEQANQTSKD